MGMKRGRRSSVVEAELGNPSRTGKPESREAGRKAGKQESRQARKHWTRSERSHPSLEPGAWCQMAPNDRRVGASGGALSYEAKRPPLPISRL